MGIRWVLATAVASSLVFGCSDDDGGESRDAEDVPEGAADLADKLGCDRTEPGMTKAWDEERSLQCFVDEGWAATIHAPLADGTRTSALGLLEGRYSEPGSLVPCPDGSHLDDVSVIAGETWIVVVTDDRGAEQVLDRLGGEVQPRSDGGPPISYFALPCP